MKLPDVFIDEMMLYVFLAFFWYFADNMFKMFL